MNSKEVVKLVIKVFLYEVSISLKVGFVSCFSNGLYKDMDFYIFIDLVFFLSYYFFECYIYG